jgi:hypothetical protein
MHYPSYRNISFVGLPESLFRRGSLCVHPHGNLDQPDSRAERFVRQAAAENNVAGIGLCTCRPHGSVPVSRPVNCRNNKGFRSAGS